MSRPTSVTLLSIGSPTKDEDPSVIRARDGKIFVAWFLRLASRFPFHPPPASNHF